MHSTVLSTDKLHPPKWLMALGHWLSKHIDLSHLDATRWTLAVIIAITAFALAMLGARSIEALQAPPTGASPMTPLDVPLVLERLRAKPLFESTTKLPAVARKPSRRPSPWQLQGLFSGISITEGSAILSNGGQPAVLARSGTLLDDGTRLLEVHRDHVVLQRTDGGKQSLQLSSPEAAVTVGQQIASTLARTPATAATVRTFGAGNTESPIERKARIRQRLETLRQRARNSSSGPS